MIVVAGPGSVGGFVGAMLAANGERVAFVGRGEDPPFPDGLSAVAMGRPPVRVEVFEDPEHLVEADLVIVAVKSKDTAAAARRIAETAPADARVVNLQNGVTNGDVLRAHLGDRVCEGMFGFNLVRTRAGEIVQMTDGEIVLDQRAADTAQQLRGAGLQVRTHSNMKGILWAKLLMNLNNPLNALSGKALKQELSDRRWRRVFATCMREGIAVSHAEGIVLERVAKLPSRLIPPILSLPNSLFLRIASSLVNIDPEARSSMADDYTLGRPSEVNWLNGHVVKRAKALGLIAPMNEKVTAAVMDAFAMSPRPPLSFDPEHFLSGG
ncbi:2-dehydropantoate 2-reductase [Aestuariibius sp. 2305UL40-4]|uniref:2-dehydropantoate 2-reductase n=1 Tax=Aestuariibius violaceus TaxID=3234132 RepID=UPI00345E6753